jgi:SPX domain protein involved in polyphosphate accumulation
MKRYEYKYLISAAQSREIASRLAGAFERDSHGESYLLTSLYFDDDRFTAYRDKIAGVKDRVKYRLRFYGNDESYIVFEAKRKSGKMVDKTSFVVSRADADALINGDYSVLAEYGAPLAEEFFALARRKNYHPAAVTIYTREAFVHPASNMRITFDRGLETRADYDIFKSGVQKRIYDSDSTIMEVKFDDVMPSSAKTLIPFIGQPTAISKYCLCLELSRKLRGLL